MAKVQQLFEKIVDKLENNPAPVHSYLWLYLAILTIRLTLEFFSSKKLFRGEDVLHIGLWFTFIVAAFILQLHLFSKVDLRKIVKLVTVSFSFALTAPILDLIITAGVGAHMNYLSIHSSRDLIWSYLTLGGSSLMRGATPGIRIEIALLVLACFNYIRTKRNSWLMGFLGAWMIYTVLFFSGTIPAVLGYVISFLKLNYTVGDQSTSLFLAVLDLIVVLGLYLRYPGQQLTQWLRRAPWSYILAATAAAAAGAMLSRRGYPGNWSLNPTTLFWFPLLFFLLIALTVLTGSRRQAIAHPHARYIFPAIIFLSALIHFHALFGSVLIGGLIMLLKAEPLRLEQYAVLRHLLRALLLVAAALFGFMVFMGPMIGFPWIWLTGIFSAGLILSLAMPSNRHFKL